LGGQTLFEDDSNAGTGTFTNQGGAVAGSGGGNTTFTENAAAIDATFVNNGSALSNAGGGYTNFIGNSSADAATLIANGGSGSGQGGVIYFSEDSAGGSSRVEVFGNGMLDISSHNATGVTIGSIEGDGMVSLGVRTLTVGSNNMSTTFSGVMQGGGGSLTKIGAGTLTLSGANTYTGATTVNAGTLLVTGTLESDITVNSGATLKGTGTVSGIAVTSGGTLAPGSSPGILFATGNLTLSLGATYLVELNGPAVGTHYDQTEVVGTVSLGNATLSIDLGFTPATNTSFMIISNALGDAVVGTFNGLPDGAIFTADGQAFMISYHGGNGNDVVLVAVPEPANLILLGLGGAALLLFRHRAKL
jgi:autotransporter-associated beta strand protein